MPPTPNDGAIKTDISTPLKKRPNFPHYLFQHLMDKSISICCVPGLLYSFFHYFCQKRVLPLIFILIHFLCSICTISILTVTYRNLLVHQYYFRETKTVFKIWICPVRKTCISIKIDIPISSLFLITSFHILYTGDTILFI